MEFERDTLTQVMEARAKAVSATGPADAARKEGELTQALGRLFAVAENYPTLKANENVKMLQEELSVTENKIGLRAAVLQRHRDEVQHGAADVPDQRRRVALRLHARRALRDHRGRRARRCRPSISRCRNVRSDGLNLYEQQAVEPPAHLAGHGRVRRVSAVSRRGFDLFYLGRSAVRAGRHARGARRRLGVSARQLLPRRPRRLSATGAVPIERGCRRRRPTSTLKLRQLHNVVDEMAIASGLPRPQRVRRARPRSERVCDGPRSRARLDRRHARPARVLNSRRAPGRRRARDEPHPQSRHPADDDRRGARRRGRAAVRLGGARHAIRGGGGSGRAQQRYGGGGGLGVIVLVIWIVAVIVSRRSSGGCWRWRSRGGASTSPTHPPRS